MRDHTELKEKIARGDQQSFTTFYNIYYPIIYGFSRHLLRSEELAEDVVQETMIHVWQLGFKLHAVNNLESYIKTFARRRAVDLLRHRSVEQKAEKSLGVIWKEVHNDTEEGILLEESRKILREGVRQLPQQQRLVYELCHQDGLKYEEVANRMSISAGTVKTHLKLAMRFLREYVKKHMDAVMILILFKLF